MKREGGEAYTEQPFSAAEIERAEFPIAIRGYDRDEVDAYLKMLAADYRGLEKLAASATQTTERPYEALGQEVGALLQHAKDIANNMRRRSEEDAAAVRLRAQDDATKKRKEALDSAQKIVEHAQREAKEVEMAAEREAAEHLKEAARRIQRLQATETDLSKRLSAIESTLSDVHKELETSQGTSLAEEVAQLAALRRTQKKVRPGAESVSTQKAEQPAPTPKKGEEKPVFLDDPLEDRSF